MKTHPFELLGKIDQGSCRLSCAEEDKDFQEEKTIKIPMQFKGAISIWGLENRALLKGAGKGSFWRLDLETEDWKKVY